MVVCQTFSVLLHHITHAQLVGFDVGCFQQAAVYLHGNFVSLGVNDPSGTAIFEIAALRRTPWASKATGNVSGMGCKPAAVQSEFVRLVSVRSVLRVKRLRICSLLLDKVGKQ